MPLYIPINTLQNSVFQHGAGTAWYYRPVANQQYPHVHLGASTGSSVPAGQYRIDFVSITLNDGGGQNLAQFPDGVYNLNTMGVVWGPNGGAMQGALTNIGVARS